MQICELNHHTKVQEKCVMDICEHFNLKQINKYSIVELTLQSQSDITCK